jgi:hypothetical protein
MTTDAKKISEREIGLDRACVVTIVGELVAAGMAEHVGVDLDAQIGCVEPFVSAC